MPEHHLDLDAYCSRTGWSGERAATWATLRGLHLAHALAVPFENADVVLGRVPSLATADLEAKLVAAGRGGYCFEQNTLLAAVLERLGVGVTRLAARVRLGAGPADVRPRTHMLLLVDVPGEEDRFVADVGFGGDGLLEPLPLRAGVTSHQGGWRFRLEEETTADGDGWALRTRAPHGWVTLYGFTLAPQQPSDFDVANWYIATNPRSPFTGALFAQRSGLRERVALRDLELTTTSCDGTRTRTELKDDHDVLRVLATTFGVVLPFDTRFGAGG